MHNIVFENGWFLWFELLIPLLVAYYLWDILIHQELQDHVLV